MCAVKDRTHKDGQKRPWTIDLSNRSEKEVEEFAQLLRGSASSKVHRRIPEFIFNEDALFISFERFAVVKLLHD